MHIDSLVVTLTGTVFTLVLIGIVLNRLKIPYVIGYLCAGVIIGPFGLKLVEDPKDLHRMESIGIILLLFFVGMEISLSHIVTKWRVSILGTFLQILTTVLIVIAAGNFMGWSFNASVLLGCVISISSTAVIIKILTDWNEMQSPIGQDVISILIIQDMAIIPMMIVFEFLGGKEPNTEELILQVLGGIIILSLLIFLTFRENIRLPFGNHLKRNKEMQIFSALILCFGLAFLTELFKLSGALGAFVAGILVASAKETEWVRRNLEPFKILFVALFFVSIGMLLDLNFILKHWQSLAILVVLTFTTNTFINSIILKVLGISWKESLYGGALLSQIGEFSLVLISVGLQAKIIGEFTYQMTLALIAIMLFLSPLWISWTKKVAGIAPNLTPQKVSKPIPIDETVKRKD